MRESDRSKHSFDYLFYFALITLANALEYDPSAVDGAEALLRLASACQWIKIAGSKLWIASTEGTQYFVAGPTWIAKGGAHVVCQARWAMWADRLEHLTNSNMISGENKQFVRLAVERLQALRSRESLADGTWDDTAN